MRGFLAVVLSLCWLLASQHCLVAAAWDLPHDHVACPDHDCGEERETPAGDACHLLEDGGALRTATADFAACVAWQPLPPVRLVPAPAEVAALERGKEPAGPPLRRWHFDARHCAYPNSPDSAV